MRNQVVSKAVDTARLQLSGITPSLPWHSRLLFLGLDSTLASCPNFRVHLWITVQAAYTLTKALVEHGQNIRSQIRPHAEDHAHL